MRGDLQTPVVVVTSVATAKIVTHAGGEMSTSLFEDLHSAQSHYKQTWRLACVLFELGRDGDWTVHSSYGPPWIIRDIKAHSEREENTLGAEAVAITVAVATPSHHGAAIVPTTPQLRPPLPPPQPGLMLAAIDAEVWGH